jgi:hypothetical protein
MPQLADPPMVEPPVQGASFVHSLDPAETEFGYRPVPMSAVAGLLLALLSSSALFAWLAIPLAVVAAAVSLLAVVRIARSEGEFAGMWLAAGGLGLSLVMGVAGVLLTIHRYQTEIPPGYERVSFAHDISARGVGRHTEGGKDYVLIPPEVRALEGKPIYLKGFIYPTGRPYALTQFILCKDNAQCCFGGQPALQDMIGVLMTKNQTTDYNPALMGVAGKLKINPHYGGGNLEPIYLLEADYVAPAKTSL